MSFLEHRWARRSVIFGAAVILVVLTAIPAIRLYGSSEYKKALSDSGELNLDLASFEKGEIPDHQNAATWLQAGAAAIIWSPEDGDVIADVSKSGPYETWPEDLRRRIRDMLERHRGALETIHNAAELQESNYKIRYRDGLDAEIPDLLSLMQAARTLLAEARIRAADGDEEQLLLVLATMGRLSMSLEEERTLITDLIGIACERLLWIVTAEVISVDQPWAAQPEFLENLRAILPPTNTATMITGTLDAWTAIMLSDPSLGERSEDLKTLRDVSFFSRTFESLNQAAVLNIRSDVLELLNTPFGRTPQRFTDLAPPTLAPNRNGIHEDHYGFLRALARSQSIAAQRQLVLAAITLRTIGATEGAYPQQAPEIKELVKPDPFTDRLLVYNLTADGKLIISLDGAPELLEQIALPSMAKAIVPVVLPPIES